MQCVHACHLKTIFAVKAKKKMVNTPTGLEHWHTVSALAITVNKGASTPLYWHITKLKTTIYHVVHSFATTEELVLYTYSPADLNLYNFIFPSTCTEC